MNTITKTAYEWLEVKESATLDEIKRAYRRQVMKHHPDRKGGNVERMKIVNEAYEVLSKYRDAYDAELRKMRNPQPEIVMHYTFDIHGTGGFGFAQSREETNASSDAFYYGFTAGTA